MRGHRFVVSSAMALALSCTLVLGCSLLKKKGGAGGGDEDAATVTVTGTGAKNEKDVLRYASEIKVNDEPGVIGKDVTKARTFPASGAEVATLSKGTQVIQIAKFFSTGVLVIFTDPATADGSKLMGWVTPESLAAPGAVATNTAPPPQVFTAAKPVDAGAKDSGAADAGDAGAADAGKAADAGPATAGTAITAVPGPGGSCPGGFALIQPPPLCRKLCATDADCPKGSGAICKTVQGRKICGVK